MIFYCCDILKLEHPKKQVYTKMNDEKSVESTPTPEKQVKDLKTRQKEYKERQKQEKSVRLEVLLPEGVGQMLDALVASEPPKKGKKPKKSKKDVVAHLIEKEYKRMYALKNSRLKKYLDESNANNNEEA